MRRKKLASPGNEITREYQYFASVHCDVIYHKDYTVNCNTLIIVAVFMATQNFDVIVQFAKTPQGISENLYTVFNNYTSEHVKNTMHWFGIY